MQPDTESLRATLKQYIGPAYERALRNTGSEERARAAARRAMELLKLALEQGAEPSKALVLRITDDCCNQEAFFNRQQEEPVQKLEEQPAPAQDEQPGQAPVIPPPAAPAQRDFVRPTPAEEIALRPQPARELAARPASKARSRPAHSAAEAEGEAFPPRQKEGRKARARDRVSPVSVLLVMFLSLVVVLLVIVFTVMLCADGTAPDGGWRFASSIYTWINTHIFPLQ